MALPKPDPWEAAKAETNVETKRRAYAAHLATDPDRVPFIVVTSEDRHRWDDLSDEQIRLRKSRAEHARLTDAYEAAIRSAERHLAQVRIDAGLDQPTEPHEPAETPGWLIDRAATT